MKARSSQRVSFGRKAWLFFRWMLLALAVAGALVWIGISVGGLTQNILVGCALAIMVAIGLWGSAAQGEVYRRSAPMNVPFVGKEEESSLARWGTEDGFNPQGTRPTYVDRTPAVGTESPSDSSRRR